MLFRYDFNEKLDLSRFKKQAPHYINSMREITYDLFLPNYKMVVEIARPEDSVKHTASLSLYEIERDNGIIIKEKVIIPLIDTRFKEISYIKEMFKQHYYKAHFDSENAEDTVEKICKLLRLIFKINNLLAFL